MSNYRSRRDAWNKIPRIDGAYEQLSEIALANVKELYGKTPPDLVTERLDTELSVIKENDHASIFIWAYRLARDIEAHGYIAFSRGSVGSSFVAFLMGLTRVNPLKPHYICTECHHMEFVRDGDVHSGFDLPEKVCPVCGHALNRDGHNISFEAFLGTDGEELPSFNFCIFAEYEARAKEILNPILNEINLCFLALPHYYVLSVTDYLEKYTGVSIKNAPLDDPKVYSLFTSPDALGVSSENSCFRTGSFSLPDFSSRFMGNLLTITKPKNFFELMKALGLKSSVDGWFDNAEELLTNGTCSLCDVVAFREDIMTYLIGKGIGTETAYEIMEIVRQGKAPSKLTEEHLQVMRDHGVPEWYIDSIMKIRYLFPKAFTAGIVMTAVQLGWYKLYYPAEYYAAYFTAYSTAYDVSVTDDLVKGYEHVKSRFDFMIQNDDPYENDDNTRLLHLACEALARGIAFLPPDEEKSHEHRYVPESGAVRLPLSSNT